MNERIIKLYEQAQDEVVDSDCADYYERIQLKFAELIVRECADKAHELIKSDGNEFPMKSVSYRLKQHFGVEE